MPKFKGKPSRSKSPAGPRGGGSGYSGCDTLLVPRIQEYARSNDIADVDDVVEHLRSCYREYLRKPMLIFRKGVERAIDEVRRRGPPLKPSVSIEDMEAAHLERRGSPRMAPRRATTPTPTPTTRAATRTATRTSSRGRMVSVGSDIDAEDAEDEENDGRAS